MITMNTNTITIITIIMIKAILAIILILSHFHQQLRRCWRYVACGRGFDCDEATDDDYVEEIPCHAGTQCIALSARMCLASHGDEYSAQEVGHSGQCVRAKSHSGTAT